MRVAYEYAIVRVVPRVERGEFVNAGILLYCDTRSVLCARIELDEARLLTLDPRVDLALVRDHLCGFERVCAGGALAGPIGSMDERERWRWLTSPRSTILQTSPAHGGIADDLEAVIERLLASLVRPVEESKRPVG